jgi:hypothetical protein
MLMTMTQKAVGVEELSCGKFEAFHCLGVVRVKRVARRGLYSTAAL